MDDSVIINKKKDKYFWLTAGLLCILLIAAMARDINRPFTGLHSWAEAASAWRAKNFLKYDLEYTKGLAVWAVGDPPTINPNRSLDHPQLGLFLPALDMLVFGADERGLRVGGIIRAVISLLIFLKLLKALLDNKTALIAGLLFVIFPITGYFGVRGWVTPAGLAACWFYLVVIGSVKTRHHPNAYHKLILAILLFLLLQLSWEGFFYAMAIGVHYVFRCVRRKQFPDKTLLAILIIAPLSSLLIDFTIMAAGHNWDWQKIVALYKWRAGSGEMAEHDWSKWFVRFWEYAVTNFTQPILIISILYLTLGQLFTFMSITDAKKNSVTPQRFPQFWLFLMPGVFQLFILKGALWWHQYWETPFVPFVAIAVALAVVLVCDFLRKIHPAVSIVGYVVVLSAIFVPCVAGWNNYYERVDFSREKVELFKTLNRDIPADTALLSFESFVRIQNAVKGAHYRPEIAWYLDREIIEVRSIADINKYAEAQKYPRYLIPAYQQLAPLIKPLQKQYKFEIFPGAAGEKDENDKTIKIGSPPYIVFDLNSPVRD